MRSPPMYSLSTSGVLLGSITARTPVVAANAPRRYVSIVGRQGPDALLALPAQPLAGLPPLPVLAVGERAARMRGAKIDEWRKA